MTATQYVSPEEKEIEGYLNIFRLRDIDAKNTAIAELTPGQRVKYQKWEFELSQIVSKLDKKIRD